MQEGLLNIEERKLLKEELRQGTIPFILVGICCVPVLAIILALAKKSSCPFINERINWISPLVITSFLFGFLLTLYLKVKYLVLDLRAGRKIIVSGIVVDKRLATKWGWHGNPAADLTSQPKLEEYLLKVDSKELLVEKGLYDQFIVGDRVEVSIGPKSNLLLGIKRIQ